MTQLKEGHSPRVHEQSKAGSFGVEDSGLPIGEELKLLREENASLQVKIEELENMVVLASQDADERNAKCQREYERLIEEKTEVIRTLHHKNGELRAQVATTAAGLPEGASSGELADRQQLLELHRQLEDQRRQIKEDEESMMGQLRQMEMALAKDRAELARQRSDVQRLHAELKRELEVASRDGGLRERLSALHRRANDTTAPHPSINQKTPAPNQVPKPAVPPGANITKSGLFRRIFGNGQ